VLPKHGRVLECQVPHHHDSGACAPALCKFCDVPTGKALPPDPDEPARVAAILAELGLAHTVITCVTRDRVLPMAGQHTGPPPSAAVKRALDPVYGAGSLLVSDFKGDTQQF